MKRRARSRTSQRPRASFLSILGIVLVFSLLVFFGASGFSGKAVDEQFGNSEVTERIFATCFDQPLEARFGVPNGVEEQNDPSTIGNDIGELISTNGNCQNACSNAIFGNVPVQTSTGLATFIVNCDLKKQIPQVLNACADACDRQSSYTGYSEQEYQYNNQPEW